MPNKDNVLNVLEQTEEKEKRFFAAWKRGVGAIGHNLFGPKTPASARDKNDLKPRLDRIEKSLAEMSAGEEQFISAMVSFYDPDQGEQLASRIDCQKSICGLTYNLDHDHVEILSELLLNYTGWPDPEAPA